LGRKAGRGKILMGSCIILKQGDVIGGIGQIVELLRMRIQLPGSPCKALLHDAVQGGFIEGGFPKGYIVRNSGIP